MPTESATNRIHSGQSVNVEFDADEPVPHDVPVLVAARLLKPLGNPVHNSVKFLSTVELLELMKDRVWLAKVTNAINGHWRKQNAAKHWIMHLNCNAKVL